MTLKSLIASRRKAVPAFAALAALASSGIAASCMLRSEPASALVVYDPSNYAQNVLIAARTLQQVNNQIKSLQNQAQSLINQRRNLSTISFPELQTLTQTLRQIDTLMGRAQGIQFRVADVDSQFSQLYPDAFSRSLKLDAQVTAARLRLDAQVSAYRATAGIQAQIAENIESDRTALATFVERSQGAEGSLQVQQATNQLLALVVKQQLQVQQMMAAQYRAQTLAGANGTQAHSEAQNATKQFLGARNAYTPK